MKECSSYRPGRLCRDGFPQNAMCRGNRCSMCGRPSQAIPPCQNEDLGLPWIDPDTGAVVHFPTVN